MKLQRNSGLIIFGLWLLGSVLQGCSLPAGQVQGEIDQRSVTIDQCPIDEPPDALGMVTVNVYLICNNTVQDVPRKVPDAANTETLLTTTIEALLAGPTEEERAVGLTSWFSSSTAGMLNSVTINSENEAIIDFVNFSEVIPNASTSAGSASLISQLNKTVFQFGDVKSITYQFDGSCEAFWNWLQSNCQRVIRE